MIATAQPIKAAEYNRPKWVYIQPVGGSVQVSGSEQDLEAGAGITIAAGLVLSGYWCGPLWIQGAGVTVQIEAFHPGLG